MAYKKYAYYNKGNKIALIEKADSTSSGFLAVAHCTLGGYTTKDTCEAAGGQWIPGSGGSIETVGEYKSPASTVAEGLEIEYTYAPTYHILAGADINDATRAGSGTLGAEYPFFGYTSKGGYLAFVHCNQGAAFVDWSGSGYNEEFVVDDYILVSGSQRWNGLHTVKSRESDGGMIVTNTPFSAKFSYEGRVNIVASTLKITGDSASDDKPAIDNIFGTDSSADQYMVATALADSHNKQILKVARTDEGELTVSIEIGFTQGKWTETNPATISDETDEDCTIYKVIKDNLIVYPNNAISVMKDETFELDLTRYQANAVILYMRSKLAEEMGNIELYEYYTAKFTKQLEKASGSRKYGPHIVQGHGMTRK